MSFRKTYARCGLRASIRASEEAFAIGTILGTQASHVRPFGLSPRGADVGCQRVESGPLFGFVGRAVVYPRYSPLVSADVI